MTKRFNGMYKHMSLNLSLAPIYRMASLIANVLPQLSVQEVKLSNGRVTVLCTNF